MCVSLVSTPQSGTWLTATPEILLEGHGHEWRTIALAGTMRLRNDKADNEGQHLRWSAKNIQEQRYVASYLADVLRRYADDRHEEGPRTVRAANLVHLRSDFTFTLNNNCTRVGELLEALHPTPAVCGLPKEEAQRFILAHEHTPRHYYSGFMGPLNIAQSTHLYVSLRCMHISTTACHLYAGGGLLRESIERQEWQETEAKMEAMRRLLSPLTSHL
jgi:isochorismate synthase